MADSEEMDENKNKCNDEYKIYMTMYYNST